MTCFHASTPCLWSNLLLSIQALKTCMPNLGLLQFSFQKAIGKSYANWQTYWLIRKLFHSYFHHRWNVLMMAWLLQFVLLALICGNSMPRMIIWTTSLTWSEHLSKPLGFLTATFFCPQRIKFPVQIEPPLWKTNGHEFSWHELNTVRNCTAVQRQGDKLNNG